MPQLRVQWIQYRLNSSTFLHTAAPFFDALQRGLVHATATGLRPRAPGRIRQNMGGLLAVRNLTGEVRGYPAHFVRDATGVWRINSM